MKIRIAIMGAGKISKRVALGILASDNCELVLIASRDLQKAKVLADEVGVSNYSDDYQDLYKADIDAIYITTINQLHFQHIKDALEHGKHVICEKPMLVRAEDVDQLYTLANKNNCFLLEAMKCRYLPTIEKVRSLVSKYGYPKNVSATFCRNENIPLDHWVYDPVYGGSMVDVGSYVYSWVFDLFPEPLIEVAKHSIDVNAVDESAWIYGKNDKGLLLQLGVSKVFTLANKAEITGENYRIVAYDFWKSFNIEVFYKDQLIDSFKETFISEFVYQVDYFCEIIKKGDIINANNHQVEFLSKIMKIYQLR